MSTETTNKKIKIDNGTTFGRTYTDKAVDERLQGLVSTTTFTPVQEKANNSLQKPAGLTKTELVGVGTNGQENIEIGDNLTLANGKLSATGGGGGVGIIDISSTWSAITPTDFKSLKFKSYLVGNMIYIEIKALFKNRPEAAMALFQNTTYIIPEDVTLPFFDGLNVKRIIGNDNKKLYVANPVDKYKLYLSGWFTIEA